MSNGDPKDPANWPKLTPEMLGMRPSESKQQANAAPPGVADVERILGGTTPAYTISDTTAAPAEAPTPRRWHVKDETGESLIEFWRSRARHSNEVAAAEIIDQLERELAEQTEAADESSKLSDDLQRQLTAALSRERQLGRELAVVIQRCAECIERERLANERADLVEAKYSELLLAKRNYRP